MKVGLKLTVVFLGPLSTSAKAVYKGTASSSTIVATSALLVLIMACTSILALSSAGIEVAIERDWYVIFEHRRFRLMYRVTTIAQGDDTQLTKLNTHMRRIDLLSKLSAPVSFLQSRS